MIKNSDKKAKDYVKLNKIFPLLRTTKIDLYVLDGYTGTHTIRHDKTKNVWTCNCKNIRLTECSHIKGCKLFIEINKK